MSSTSFVPPSDPGALRRVPRGGLPRYGNLVLGSWLFASALLWPHPGALRASTLCTGLGLLLVSLLALRRPGLRWLNLGLAAWLVASSFVVWPAGARTFYNHVICALLVLGVFVCPDSPAPPIFPQRF